MQKQSSFKIKSNIKKGKLYLVPTPIGNLEDITYRAVRILKEVDIIASEDTRNTIKLLNHFKISAIQKSLNEHNHYRKIPQLLSILKRGKNVAQVSDAGMPCISDPGYQLVLACIRENIPIISLPGPSAGLTAIIASGLNPSPNYFHGFLPRSKKEQVKELNFLKERKESMIFFESPYRLKSTLKNMLEVFGNRLATVCRELTKVHEEYLRSTIYELIIYLEDLNIKGECCLVISGKVSEKKKVESPLNLKKQVKELISDGIDYKKAIHEVAKANNCRKKKVYNSYHSL